VPTPREAASPCLTQSSYTKATTAPPATSYAKAVIALPTIDNGFLVGKPTGSFANTTSESEAIMPTQQECCIITTTQYFKKSIVDALSSNSSDYSDTVPKVSLVLVLMNSLTIRIH
jgi:hypothetical protein